jgi:hypothetical protein
MSYVEFEEDKWKPARGASTPGTSTGFGALGKLLIRTGIVQDERSAGTLLALFAIILFGSIIYLNLPAPERYPTEAELQTLPPDIRNTYRP